MKRYFNIFLSLVLILVLGACSKEKMFEGPEDAVTGSFSTRSLLVELTNENGPKPIKGQTRAAAPSVDDFNVEFFLDGKNEPEASYKYSEMPEIVVLPVGSYTVRASYGENADAAWEAPYYKGETNIEIKKDEITEGNETIVCRFSNVRVSVDFDAALKAAMGPDAKVTVKVGESGTLDFTVADVARSGYFAYVEDSHTLAATFSGSVEGYQSTETKAYDDVKPGNHYRITFRLHDAGEEDPGQITGDDIVVVDASVIEDDMNVDGDVDDDVIVDDMRPGEDPVEPENPDDPSKPAPTITPTEPYKMGVPNTYTTHMEGEGDEAVEVVDDPVRLDIHSDAQGGITAFEVVIDSETLTADILGGVGLSTTLDLINPGNMAAGLSGLGFPIGDEVRGQSDVTFDISSFVPLLGLYGAATHNFIFKVTDANGSTESTFTLLSK